MKKTTTEDIKKALQAELTKITGKNYEGYGNANLIFEMRVVMLYFQQAKELLAQDIILLNRGKEKQ
jgi:hypothetical protein